jgi:hypothetical protein
MFEHLRHGETDIFGDLAQKNWRNVAARVKRAGCGAARAVSKLFVRATLSHFRETQPARNRYDFGGLENRDITRNRFSRGAREGEYAIVGRGRSRRKLDIYCFFSA